MSEDGERPRIERFRHYLVLLARLQLESQAVRLDASDVVQQTLLEAHKDLAAFRGTTDAELAAWLRRGLTNNLVDGLRQMRRAKRDVALERSLEAQLAGSSAQIERLLAVDGSSPSQHAVRTEQLLQMADAIEELPPAQREAVVLHHLQACALSEVARRMDKSQAAVAGLIHRGLKRLRELMEA